MKSLMEKDLYKFIDDLIDFVNKEYDENNFEMRKIWSLPLKQRIEDGEAIDKIEIIKEGFLRIVVKCSSNISKFRESSKVRLHRGDPAEGISCEIIADYGHVLVLQAGFKSRFDNVKGNNWVLDNDLIDIRHILINALLRIKVEDNIHEHVVGLLSGEEPNFETNAFRKAKDFCKNIEFNPKQEEAFLKAVSTRNYFLIQGPPGTGKTWVLAHIAHFLALQGQRILITGFTHRAINNALLKIVSVTNYQKVIKVGQETYRNGLSNKNMKVANYEHYSETPYSINEKGLIVGGTCFAARTKRLAELNFDTIIFDEASQVTIPLAIAGMISGQKYLFIGDHMQMPPLILATHREEWVKKSLFEFLIKENNSTMLNITYRMNKEINQFPSEKFYQGLLVPHDSCRNRQLLLKTTPNKLKNALDPAMPCVFLELNHTNKKMRSKEEAILVSALITEAIKCGIPSEDIAVITPYRAQGRLIRNLLVRIYGPENDINQKIIVDTVERIQGQEKEMIIISLTTSDPVHSSQNAEFFFHPNRLNVALTRAKTKRIVIGSKFLFSTRSENNEIMNWVRLFEEFYKVSRKIIIKM